mgnify:CR=1 FL=1
MCLKGRIPTQASKRVGGRGGKASQWGGDGGKEGVERQWRLSGAAGFHCAHTFFWLLPIHKGYHVLGRSKRGEAKGHTPPTREFLRTVGCHFK